MKKAATSLLFFFFFYLAVPGQSNDDKLVKLSKVFQDEISREMSGWSCRSLEPSKGVIIQYWSSGQIGVKISVVEYASIAKAAEGFQEFKTHLKIEEEATSRHRGREIHLIKEESLNLGDEGFVWDIRGSDAVVFRKGEMIINFSVFSPPTAKDVYFSRKFAGLVAAALKSP